jgi:hypothetical protein
MKTVTQAFLDAWNTPGNKFAVRQVKYKRRYWNGAAIVEESSWTTLEMKDFSQIGSLVSQLDTVYQNQFMASNITLNLGNKDGRWFPWNPDGLFGPDSVAASGYKAYGTLFQVLAGYELADSSEEVLTMFTGKLVDYNCGSKKDDIEFYISGYEEKLQKADAEQVYDAFTNETTIPTTGDGANRVFVTASLGVGSITVVRVAGVVVSETNYRISGLNQYGVGATISFLFTVDAGAAVDCTGTKWKASQTIETLAGLLCDQANVTPVNRSIYPVIFPNGVNGFKQMNTQALWEAGTLQNITSQLIPDSICKKWFIDFGLFSQPTLPIQSWRARFSISSGWAQSWFYVNDQYTPSSSYALLFSATEVRLCRVDLLGAVQETLGQVITPTPAGMAEYKVERNNSTSEFKVWVNGTLKLTVTNTHFTEGYARPLQMTVQGSTDFAREANSGYLSSDLVGSPAFDGDQAGEHLSPDYDLLTAPTAWGRLEVQETLNGGSTAYYTRVRDEGGAWDSWTAVAGNGQILSALKRHLQIKSVLTQSASGLISPEVKILKANFTSSIIFVSLANFTGMKCDAAMAKLAKLCNYEYGMDDDGLFYFRPKETSTTPDLILDQKNIVEIVSLKPGWKEVINSAKVRYGNDSSYCREYNSNSGIPPEASPTSADEFGLSLRYETMSHFLLENDVDLASGMAQKIYTDDHLAKIRTSILFRLIPHINLSNVLQLSFYDDPLKEDNVFGDPMQETVSAFGEDYSVLLRDKKFKVIGRQHDFTNETSLLTLLEVL